MRESHVVIGQISNYYLVEGNGEGTETRIVPSELWLVGARDQEDRVEYVRVYWF